jgi:hypothetical protein
MFTGSLEGNHSDMQNTGELFSGAWQTSTAIFGACHVEIMHEEVALPL